jgi:LysM repeat protein
MRWLILLSVVLFLMACQTDEVVTVTAAPIVTPSPTPIIGVFLQTRAVPTTAVLQTTPTPLPPPTETPTPTPIIYVIEEGDTLLGIAIERNTTVVDIEALNPGIRPELLQIGQSVVLPPPATAAAPVNAATPIPINIRVAQVQFYRTPIGDLWLLGEVVNEAETAAANVQVAIDLLNEAGEVVGTGVVWTELALIPPGAAAPFGVLIQETPDEFARPSVTIAAGETVADLGSRYLEVVVGETAAHHNEDRIQISGQISNTGTFTATQISLVTTLYDSSGHIVGFHQLPVAEPLPPGAMAPFVLDVVAPGGLAVDFNIVVQATKD